MMQTKEEKNKVARDNRFSREHNRQESIKHSILCLFDRARKEKLTFRQLLDYRSTWIIGHASYQSLPDWRKHYLSGVWDCCEQLLRKELVDCYDHPETGRRMRTNVLLDMGKRNELKQYHVCYDEPGFPVYSSYPNEV